MKKMNLIVMLTHNDFTVSDALEVFNACRELPVNYWGAKEQGISREELKKLFSAIRESGKVGVLEVVAYEEDECLEGARLAAYCGCDMLLGTKYFDSVHALCRENGIKYMPFVGEVSGRPSVLQGSAAAMVEETHRYEEKGVYGVDLLGYRFVGDIESLCRAVVEEGGIPTCLAGSINSQSRLAQVCQLQPDYFTVGSAFFQHCFGDEIPQQIRFVCDYIENYKG